MEKQFAKLVGAVKTYESDSFSAKFYQVTDKEAYVMAGALTALCIKAMLEGSRKYAVLNGHTLTILLDELRKKEHLRKLKNEKLAKVA